MASRERPHCMKCRHFFVTWFGDLPRACRAYGFRSRDLPSQVVLRESGIPCQLYERRRRGRGGGRQGELLH